MFKIIKKKEYYFDEVKEKCIIIPHNPFSFNSYDEMLRKKHNCDIIFDHARIRNKIVVHCPTLIFDGNNDLNNINILNSIVFYNDIYNCEIALGIYVSSKSNYNSLLIVKDFLEVISKVHKKSIIFYTNNKEIFERKSEEFKKIWIDSIANEINIVDATFNYFDKLKKLSICENYEYYEKYDFFCYMSKDKVYHDYSVPTTYEIKNRDKEFVIPKNIEIFHTENHFAIKYKELEKKYDIIVSTLMDCACIGKSNHNEYIDYDPVKFPTRITVLKYCIAMPITVNEAEELMESAGYVFLNNQYEQYIHELIKKRRINENKMWSIEDLFEKIVDSAEYKYNNDYKQFIEGLYKYLKLERLNIV